MDNFTKLVKIAKDKLPTKLATLVDNTTCFGILWEDSNGVCPEMECALRDSCRTVFTETAKLNYVEEEKSVIAPRQYERTEYVSVGRPIDEIARQFVHSLGYPQELPLNWNYHKMRKKVYGKFNLVKTASYHGVFLNYNLSCRLWTNAATFGILDCSLEIAASLKDKGFSVSPIPEKNLAKSKPLTHRVYLKNIQDAELAGTQIATFNVP